MQHEEEPEPDPEAGRCVNCLARDARPGSDYCSALCRVLDIARRWRLI